MSDVLGCLCGICIKCYRKYRSRRQRSTSAEMADDSPSTPRDLLSPPLSYTMVPLDRIFSPPSSLSAIHSYNRKQSLITEQQTRFYPATILSPASSPNPAAVTAASPSLSSRRTSFFENSPYFSFSSSVKRPSLMEQKNPSIDFIIYYDIQSCSFTVRLLTARNLPAKNSDRSSNPFVNLYLLPHKEEVFKSRTSEKNLNPFFYESFVFNHIPYHEICTRTLVLRVFNAKSARHNELIGNVVLPLRKAELHGVRVSAVLNQLQDIGNATTYGDIQITLEYEESAKRVSGTIHKAINLKKMDYFGLSDPYVKINLLHQGKKTATKWYSKVVKNTLSPTFNEAFSFDVSNMKIDEVGLKVCLKDEDVFGKDDVLGVVNFSIVCTHLTGWSHWKDLVGSPGARLTRWHSLECDSTHVFKFIRNWL